MAGHPAAPIPEGAGPEEVSIQANCKGRHGADWLVRCTKAPLKREQKKRGRLELLPDGRNG